MGSSIPFFFFTAVEMEALEVKCHALNHAASKWLHCALNQSTRSAFGLQTVKLRYT